MDIAPALRRFALLGVCIPCLTASAQMSELQPGARIRIRAPGEIAGRLTGVVIARTADSLTIARPNAAPLAVAFAKLSTLEISRGKSHSLGALKGVGWGAAVGLGLGALMPITDDACTGVTTRCEPISRSSFIAVMVLGSVVWGAGIGAAVGSEHWDSALLPTRVALIPPSRTQAPGIMLGWAIGRTPPNH